MTRTVTVLGTGIMGAAMARNLVKAGLDVTVWNRSADKARPLADDGATVAEDAIAAVRGADAIVTMLFDTAAVADVMERALPAASEGAVWVQTSTVGLDGTEQLAALAERHGVAFVDAPVLGTKQPAEAGALTVVAGGPESLRARVQPVFDAIGSKTIWVGERPGDGHRLKLVANSWVGAVITGVAQAVALAEGLGVDPRLWLDAIAGGPLDSGYAQAKGKAMMAGEFPPAFTVSGVVKDGGLIADAIRGAGVDGRLWDAVRAEFATTQDAGHGDEDMAAVIHAFRPRGEGA